MKKINFYTFFDINLSQIFFAHLFSIMDVYEDFEYNVATDSETIKKYEHLFKKYNINYVNIDNKMEIFKKYEMLNSKITHFTMARLIMFDIFENFNDDEKNVYLDPDIIISKKINSKYLNCNENIAFINSSLSDKKQFSKILTFWNKKLSKYPEENLIVSKLLVKEKYFNAGVIIINDSIKLRALFNKALNYPKKLDDQTLLNINNENEILCINDLTHNNQIKNGFLKDSTIYHYSGSKKPWDSKISKSYKIKKLYIKKTKFDIYWKRVFSEGIYQPRLTLLLTLYKPKKSEINYWTKIYNYILDSYDLTNLDMHILVDGTKVNLKNIKNKKNIFINEKNVGKFKLIYNHIKNQNVRSPYFKVCDPDDLISLKKLSEIKLCDAEDKIILTSMVKFDKKPIIKTNNSIDKALKNARKNFFSSFGNSWTILPTEYIYKDVFYSGRDVTYHDDQLLGYIAYANGAKILEYKEKYFYYYHSDNGRTSFKNYDKMISKLPQTFLELKSIKDLSNFENPVTWPNDYIYYFNLRNKFLKTKNNDYTITEEVDGYLSEILKINFK